MATPNVQVILQSILTATNNLVSPAPYIANFDFQNPTLNANTIFYDPYFQATGGGASVSLPASKVFLLAVQNLSTGAAPSLCDQVTPLLAARHRPSFSGRAACTSTLILPKRGRASAR